LKDAAPVVLALPRGGVAIGAAVAGALTAALDIVLVRKIGVPWQPELALGATGYYYDDFHQLSDAEVIESLGHRVVGIGAARYRRAAAAATLTGAAGVSSRPTEPAAAACA
jgi:predicted phosphoribosyltransferase